MTTLIADIMECDVEGLATNFTGCTVRGFAKKCALEGYTLDETEWVMEGLITN